MNPHSDIQISPKGYISQNGSYLNQEAMRSLIETMKENGWWTSVTQDEWGDIFGDDGTEAWSYIQVV